MKNFKNLINRFKAFAAKSIKKEDTGALRNLLILLNHVIENMFTKYYIKSKSSEKVKIKMNIGKNTKIYILNGNLSLLGLVEKMKNENALFDEYANRSFNHHWHIYSHYITLANTLAFKSVGKA